MSTGFTYRLWLIRPKNPDNVGKEAIELATTIMRLSSGPEIGEITKAVRDGFAYNFATESGGPTLDKWARLAKRTEDEREALGFPRSHPILRRTGSYMRSWFFRSHRFHFERPHKRVPLNQLVINLGSIDPRVDTLEGGFEGPPESFLEGMGLGPQSIAESLGGGVPARPVHFIHRHFEQESMRGVDFLLGKKVKDV